MVQRTMRSFPTAEASESQTASAAQPVEQCQLCLMLGSLVLLLAEDHAF